MGLFHRRSSNDALLNFIVNSLSDVSARQYFTQDSLSEFRQGLADKSDVVAAKQYYDVTGASMAECAAAVKIAKALFGR